MSESTKTLNRNKLRVVLDKREVFPDDPGNGTPAMVYYENQHGRFSATYWCACGEGELLDDRGRTHQLTQAQLDWLDSLEPELTHFLHGER